MVAQRWMKGSWQRKLGLIKNNVTGNIYATSVHVKALIAFVIWAIPKKNTCFGSKREFVLIIRSQIGPTSASKNAEHVIIGWGFEYAF